MTNEFNRSKKPSKGQNSNGDGIFPTDIFPEDVFPEDIFPEDIFPRQRPSQTPKSWIGDK